MPTSPLPERLTPLAAAAGVRPFYGDLHNHCGLSYGHGSLEGALRNARRQLDFVSVTGHAWWPDMPVDDPSVAHIVDFHVKGFARLEQLWPGHFDTLAAFHDPGCFTVFAGYEMHSCEHGDYTILLRDLDQRALVRANTPAALKAALRDAYGDRAFAFPHHIGYRQGARGINWASFDEALSPVLEMISMHGCSESSLTPRPFLHSMGPSDGVSTVHHGLNSGHVFGLLGNTDHHSGYPGSYGHGRSVIYAPENTGAALWQALHARHCGALTGDNAHLFARIGAAMSGDVVPEADEAVLQVEALAGSFIDCIDVIRNGHLVERVSPALVPSAIGAGDALETILLLELGWGGRGTFHDWEGRIAVERGRVDAIEPRLRGPEIVSPLEGGADEHHEPRIEPTENGAAFEIRAYSNPNNVTATTQAIALRTVLEPEAEIVLTLHGETIRVPVERLLEGAKSGNLGPIDSPAWRLHPLPRPEEWQWQGKLPIRRLKRGEWIALRLRQQNGQFAWSSPFLCR